MRFGGWWGPLLLAASLGLNVAVTVIFVQDKGGLPYVKQKLGLQDPPSSPALASRFFAALPRGASDTVVAGDSHVSGAPLLDLLTPVKQRGITGETVADIRARVGQVLRPRPRRLVLLAGTNDAAEGHSVARFAADYRELLAYVGRRSPKTAVTVLTIPPSTGDLAQRIPPLNRALVALAPHYRARVVNLYSALVDRHGSLDARYTDDGIHMNDSGYARAAPVFEAAVR